MQAPVILGSVAWEKTLLALSYTGKLLGLAGFQANDLEGDHWPRMALAGSGQT